MPTDAQPQTLQFWQRYYDSAEHSQLRIAEANDIEPEHRALIVLPDIDTFHNPENPHTPLLKRRVAGYLKRFETILGGKKAHQHLSFFAMTYPSDRNTSSEHMAQSNKNPRHYSAPEAAELVEKLLLPRIDITDISATKKRLRNITFVTISYGSVFAIQLHAALTTHLKAQGLSETQIIDLLSNIFIISSSNVSNGFMQADYGFTTIYLHNLADQIACRYIAPDTHEMLQQILSQSNANITFVKTSDQQLVVLQRELTAEVHLFKRHGNNALRIQKVVDEAQHTSDLYTTKRPETGTMYSVLQRALTHGVTRTEYKSVSEYLLPCNPLVTEEQPLACRMLPYMDSTYKRKAMSELTLSAIPCAYHPTKSARC